jgi:hypothetical protein
VELWGHANPAVVVFADEKQGFSDLSNWFDTQLRKLEQVRGEPIAHPSAEEEKQAETSWEKEAIGTVEQYVRWFKKRGYYKDRSPIVEVFRWANRRMGRSAR